MPTKLEIFNKKQIKDLPEIKSGYTVRVHQRIKEGDKERIQPYEGIVIAKKHGKGINAMITVRRVSGGIGVERIFPIHSPKIEKIEILKKAKIRRSKLYYLRNLTGKKARLKNKKDFEAIVAPAPTEETQKIVE